MNAVYLHATKPQLVIEYMNSNEQNKEGDVLQ